MHDEIYIDGVALCGPFSLYLLDVKERLPKPVLKFIDVPGGSGPLDFTEAVANLPDYEQRELTFIVGGLFSQEEFKQVLHQLIARIHGKRCELRLSWDSEYTQSGRLAVEEWERRGVDGWIITIKAICSPYKSKGKQVYRFNAAGGVTARIPCGNMPTCPKIQVARKSLITDESGNSYTLYPGTYRIRDLWLTGENNYLYVNTLPDYNFGAWKDLHQKHWSEAQGFRWTALTKTTEEFMQPSTFTQIKNDRWQALADKRWLEIAHPVDVNTQDYLVSIEINWKDL